MVAGSQTTIATSDSCLDTALSHFKACASHNNMTIHQVPGDGNCMYYAIQYQLQANDVCFASISELKEMTASYFERHSDFYSQFVSDSVLSNSPMNADTEAPDEEDTFIDLIQDPHERLHARWLKYLRRVRTNAWRDNFCVAALANLFSVKTNVYTATGTGCTVHSITPFDGNSLTSI